MSLIKPRFTPFSRHDHGLLERLGGIRGELENRNIAIFVADVDFVVDD